MKKIITIISSLILLSSLIACQSNPTSFNFKINYDEFSLDFHTELQNKYINAEDYTTTAGIAAGSSSKELPS